MVHALPYICRHVRAHFAAAEHVQCSYRTRHQPYDRYFLDGKGKGAVGEGKVTGPGQYFNKSIRAVDEEDPNKKGDLLITTFKDSNVYKIDKESFKSNTEAHEKKERRRTMNSVRGSKPRQGQGQGQGQGRAQAQAPGKIEKQESGLSGFGAFVEVNEDNSQPTVINKTYTSTSNNNDATLEI